MDGSHPQETPVSRLTPGDPVRLGRALYDPARRMVALDGVETPLEPRLANVLDALLRAEGPVSRSDLLDAAWGPGEGSDEALTQVVSRLRKALGDDARPFAVIETTPKFGYAIGAGARSIPELECPAPQTLPRTEAVSLAERWWARFTNGFRRRRQFLAGLCVGFAAALLIFGWPKQITAEIEIVCNDGEVENCAQARASAESLLQNGARSRTRSASIAAS